MSLAAALVLWAAAAWAQGASGPPPVPGTVLSLGSGRAVTARLTYDRSRAREGGAILVLPK